jgi:protein ImuB
MEIACALVPEPLLRAAAEERRLPVEDVWEEELRRLEAQVGAGVECGRAGEAFFAVDGLLGIHGGERAGVLAAARRAMRLQVRIGVAPTRFAAFAAAGDGELVVPESRLREYLSHIPVPALISRLGLTPREAERLGETMRRLGIGTLGALASLTFAQVADRFGPASLAAHRIARGEEDPPRPRRPHEELAAEIELPEGTAGDRLDHALALLVDRLLAAPRRRGRTLLSLRLGAVLAEGGSWSAEQGLGRPTASARVLRTVLAPRLEALPAPAVTLRLRALALGPPATEQMELSIRGQEARRRRLSAAVREVRAAQGAEALLKVLQVNPASRVPERRAILTPFPAP